MHRFIAANATVSGGFVAGIIVPCAIVADGIVDDVSVRLCPFFAGAIVAHATVADRCSSCHCR